MNALYRVQLKPREDACEAFQLPRCALDAALDLSQSGLGKSTALSGVKLARAVASSVEKCSSRRRGIHPIGFVPRFAGMPSTVNTERLPRTARPAGQSFTVTPLRVAGFVGAHSSGAIIRTDWPTARAAQNLCRQMPRCGSVIARAPAHPKRTMVTEAGPSNWVASECMRLATNSSRPKAGGSWSTDTSWSSNSDGGSHLMSACITRTGGAMTTVQRILNSGTSRKKTLQEFGHLTITARVAAASVSWIFAL
jgi:hypothetical protein